MRVLFLLLLLANVAAFGWIRYSESRPGAGAQIGLLQISPDKVRLVGAGPAAPVPVREKAAAAPAPVCVEWGAFGASEAERAAAMLAALNLGEALSRRDAAASYWVNIPPLKSRAEAERKAGEVRGLGITEFYLVPDGPAQNAISLGVFKSEEAANNHLAQLRAKGIRSALVAPYAGAGTTFVIRAPSEAIAVKLGELKGEFPAVTLRAVACADATGVRN